MSPSAIVVPTLPATDATKPIPAANSHETEASDNDERFIINHDKYDAKTNCFNMEEGDPLIYVEGSAFGACLSAVIVNQHTDQKCEVWCEPLDE
jgi:hypothetical protein